MEFSPDMANIYMKLGKNEHVRFLESATTIREASRLLDADKPEPKATATQKPKKERPCAKRDKQIAGFLTRTGRIQIWILKTATMWPIEKTPPCLFEDGSDLSHVEYQQV